MQAFLPRSYMSYACLKPLGKSLFIPLKTCCRGLKFN